MKCLKKVLLAVFSLALVFCLGTPGMSAVQAAGTQTAISAASAIKLGSITAYFYYNTGVLTLSGKGTLSAKNGVKLDQYKDFAKEIVIEEGITSIKGLANNWTKLTRVVLPNSLKKIGSCNESGLCEDSGDLCFFRCTNLRTVKGGKNVTCVGGSGTDHAFSGSKWETAGRRKGKLVLGKVLYCYTKSDKTVTGNYTQILQYAFEGNTTLQTVKLSGIKYLGQSIFENCTKLKKAELSGSLTSLSYGTFHGCTKLSDITLPSGLKTIASEVFLNCPSLKTLTIPKSVTEIQEYAFGYKTTASHSYKSYSGTTIRGASGSAAQKYAKANKITFKKIK